MPSLADQAQAIADKYIPPTIGRPSDLAKYPETVQQFLEAVGNGNYIETSCKLAGLAKSTVYDWIKRGEQGEHAFAEFAYAVQKAEARAEAHLVDKVREAAEAGPQFWAAGMTLLERRHPDRYGKRAEEASGPRVQVTIGAGAGDVKIGIAFASTSEASVMSSPFEAKVIEPANSLETQPFALSSSPIMAVMVTNTEGHNSAASGATPGEVLIGESRQADRAEGPTGCADAEGGQPVSVAVKGRVRAGRKKKGAA